MTSVTKHIVTYAEPQLETSLTHKVSHNNVFYHIQGNVTVNVNYNSILASRPRSRSKCPGVRL